MSDHLVLHPQLATGNFIIKAIWLPGSQTELAIITADFVKVYFICNHIFHQWCFPVVFELIDFFFHIFTHNSSLFLAVETTFTYILSAFLNRFMTCQWMPWVPCTTSCFQVPRYVMRLSFSMKRGRALSPSCLQQDTCTPSSWMNPAVLSMALSMSPTFWK